VLSTDFLELTSSCGINSVQKEYNTMDVVTRKIKWGDLLRIKEGAEGAPTEFVGETTMRVAAVSGEFVSVQSGNRGNIIPNPNNEQGWPLEIIQPLIE